MTVKRCEYVNFFEIGRKSNSDEGFILATNQVKVSGNQTYLDIIEQAVKNGSIGEAEDLSDDHPQVYEAEICVSAKEGMQAYVFFLNSSAFCYFGEKSQPIFSGGEFYAPCKNFVKDVHSFELNSDGKTVEKFSKGAWSKAPMCRWASFVCEYKGKDEVGRSIDNSYRDFMSSEMMKKMKAENENLFENYDIEENIHIPENIYVPIYLNVNAIGLPNWISGNHFHASGWAHWLERLALKIRRRGRKSKYNKSHISHLTHGGPHPDVLNVFLEVGTGN